MVDRISKEERSRLMAKIKGRDTMPELLLRRALWLAGLRYRKHYGKELIDIAFPMQKVAVFVDGCFWHGCPIHGNTPSSNTIYWEAKLARNIERDRQRTATLKGKGWVVIRIWEHDLGDELSINDTVQTIMKTLHFCDR